MVYATNDLQKILEINKESRRVEMYYSDYLPIQLTKSYLMETLINTLNY